MNLEIPSPPETAAPPPPPAQDRGISPIAGRLGGRSGRLASMAALALGCGVFLFAAWDRGDGRDLGAALDDTPPRQLASFEPARRPDPPSLEGEAEDPFAPDLTMAAEPAPSSETAPADSPAGPSPAEQRRALAESAQRAPLMAYSRAGGAPPDRAPLATTAEAPPTSADAQTALDRLRRLSPIRLTRAGRLPDRNRLITAGTSLPCVLQTAMDSAAPGYVSCLIARDVYSDNGAVVLLERGTRVLGEHRGQVETGRKRLFVLWTRAVTPAGVAVSLASPAADALGRAGFDGAVDTHFWDRFGGALLLSIIEDIGSAAAGDRSSPYVAPPPPSDAASAALQGAIDIPPTLRKAQGSEVSIFVAQDLDFSEVYALRLR